MAGLKKARKAAAEKAALKVKTAPAYPTKALTPEPAPRGTYWPETAADWKIP